MSLILNESQIKLQLSFAEIMTSQVIFYDEFFKEECIKYCEERKITYLPSLEDFEVCYKLTGDKFEAERIAESHKVNVDNDVFDKSIFEKFKTHNVLFVINKNELAGVVHFCDYNRRPILIYIYSLLLEFEKGLRELLTYCELSNNDMIEFFEKSPKDSRDKRYHLNQFKHFSKPGIKEEMKEFEPFQMFYLRDLIGLTNFKKILNISESVNDIRNIAMHAKNPVKHKDYETAGWIYTFESFNIFFQSIKLLQLELRKVTNKINYKIQMIKLNDRIKNKIR